MLDLGGVCELRFQGWNVRRSVWEVRVGGWEVKGFEVMTGE